MNYIERLNNTFGDAVGFVPDRYSPGKRQAQYRWAWTPSLLYRAAGRGGDTGTFRQNNTDAWAIAKWQPPVPEHVWKQQFGNELLYEPFGSWILTDFVLPAGQEPTEALTHWAINSILEKRSLSFRECRTILEERIQKREQAARNQINDLIDDAALKYDAVPGKRGGPVSFGGV